ncbi:MAG: hypothetical protein UU70_C0030G0006 [Candidatus Yanofskybacteria bacterium GW2011_GWA1_41_6]|uniref:Large ribosomal subunit protein uL29 n=1 Tax=Candidatus Yanofskybacteria bacterium GW2011_GWA1_41_6 TaxID=1619020 RepID=A0A0G0WIY2_9BACT|nr:MAG: hypothetical protein UU70_C0030G0006 [Candidatus Yanofskybacteria bacterium GW2011_GWA1_41_6]
MKHFDINNKTQQELSSSLAEFRTKLVQLEFDRADKKLKDVSQFKKTKKRYCSDFNCFAHHIT